MLAEPNRPQKTVDFATFNCYILVDATVTWLSTSYRLLRGVVTAHTLVGVQHPR